MVMRRLGAVTFIELLVVIIIIGILASVSIPNFRKTLDNLVLENFVKDIYYLTRYLQTSAISQGNIHCLNINKEKTPVEFWATYQSENERGEKAFRAVIGKFGKIHQAPEDVVISADKTDIYFYPDGSINETTINFENRYNHKISLIIKGASGVIKIE